MTNAMQSDTDNGYVADRSSESSEGGGSDKGQSSQYLQSLTTAPRNKERPLRARFSTVKNVRASYFDKQRERLNRNKDEHMTSLCDMISQLQDGKLTSSTPTREDLTSCPIGKGWNVDKNVVTIGQALGFNVSPILLIEAQSPYRVVHANAAYRSQFSLPGNDSCSASYTTLSGFLEANFDDRMVRVRQVRGDEDEALSHFLLDLFFPSELSPMQVVA